jgi:hypothetical protein
VESMIVCCVLDVSDRGDDVFVFGCKRQLNLQNFECHKEMTRYMSSVMSNIPMARRKDGWWQVGGRERLGANSSEAGSETVSAQ